MLQETNKKRQDTVANGQMSFSDEDIKNFFRTINELFLRGAQENKKDENKYFTQDEKALLSRLVTFKDNYLAWVVNFDMPFTNNLSERALRGVKSKLKISGQFKSVDTAKYYARLKSYIETCLRNGINEMTALIRLVQGIPFTINELLNTT